MKLALFGLLCLPAALAVTPPGANLEDCTFTVGANNDTLTSYKFKEIGDTQVNILGLGDCELTAVAVGGGGSGYIGGGGSGYIVSSTITVPASELVVRVGGPGELSSLETSEGQTIITAHPGGDSPGYSGGDGYSGGGGRSRVTTDVGYDGGQDGGDGHSSDGDSPGGAGSGLDISTISMENFSLSPGAAGEAYGARGGGGGGILEAGAGPQEREYDGQGYGGGGGGRGFCKYGHGNPVLLLLEIKPKQ